MSEQPAPAAHAGSDGLWRWLVGGLVGGGALLGLLVAAYAVGFHRGERHAATPTRAATTAPPTTTARTTTPAPTTPAAVPVTPALVARGKTLYTADACSGCHSLTGASGAGPTFKGLAGGTSTLTGGKTVTADDAYLTRAIVDPDAEVVDGYRPGIMSTAIAGQHLTGKPDDVRALVAFIKSQK